MKPGSFFNDYHKYRWLEAIPALCSWGTLVGAVVLTFVTPLTMVYVIIAYDFYWMVKVAYVSTFLVISFFKYRATMRTDWVKKVRALSPAAICW